ncbi:Fc.00g051290.m01.CDS01 [Cosmosporella sp. VM-42]
MSVPLRRDPNLRHSQRPIYDMPMPFNPNTIKQNAMLRGMNDLQASFFAHMVLEQFRELHAKQPEGRSVTALQISTAVKQASADKLWQRQNATQVYLQKQGIPIGTLAGQFEQEIDRACGGVTTPEEKVTVETIIVHGQKRYKYKFSQEGLDEWFDGQDPYELDKSMNQLSLMDDKRDMITALCSNVELAVELGKQLEPEDIVSLYATNRAFHNAVKGHMLSSIRMWIAHSAPEAGEIFSFKLYRSLIISDPAGRTNGEMCEGVPEHLKPPPEQREKARTIPGLKYVQLVIGRDRYCSEIIAIMARNGHRMPPTMKRTLCKMWLLMDVATTAQRQVIMANAKNWEDEDLYNAQFFFIKLGMHFNDPIYGPCTYELLHLMMGQKGLYPLWQLLMNKKYNNIHDIIEARIRYDFRMPADHWGHDFFDKTVYTVPFAEIGIQHCEGWGKGIKHLMRPDELVPVESVRRGLELEKHLMMMLLWGYFDWKTVENLVPTEEEIYIKDAEAKLDNVDTSGHWKRKHALKARWIELPEEVKEEIIAEDEDEHLRALAYAAGANGSDIEERMPDWRGYSLDDEDKEDDEDFLTDDSESVEGETFADAYDPNDEIKRGWMPRPQAKDAPSQAPAVDDKQAWRSFVNQALMGMPVEVDKDEALKAQAYSSYYEEMWEGEAPWEEELSKMGINWHQFKEKAERKAAAAAAADPPVAINNSSAAALAAAQAAQDDDDDDGDDEADDDAEDSEEDAEET